LGWLADLFRFSGRARRRTYWIVNIVAGLAVLTGAGLMLEPRFADNIAILGVAVIVVLVGLPALAAVSVRRLHDRNRSGWWMLLYGVLPGLFGPNVDGSGPLFPMLPDAVNAALMLLSMGVSFWALVDLGILRGTGGPNRYGANPKEKMLAEVFS
jgi:uncharacterized membrane protein YhaH (DUF805 family)